VHNVAQQLGLPFHLRRLDLNRQGNLEQQARDARYAFFADLIRENAVHKVALGHTRSDQAETVLYRLLRGAGSAGLAAIRPVTNSGIIRPLLQVTRLEVEDWLKARNIHWREDSTNSELRFDRNRLRHQLLPQLEREWNPSLLHILAQTADWAFEEERYWQVEIPRLTANWVRFVNGAAILDGSRLNALPTAIARRLIREIVRQVKDDLLGLDFAHIEAVRGLASQPQGSGKIQIAGVDVLRSFNWLRFAKPGPARDPRSPVCLELVCNEGVYNRDGSALDWDKIWDRIRDTAGEPLVVRNWQPGDQFQRQGHASPQKIKELFQDFRIPVWERQDWPVITVCGSVAWAKQFGPAAEFAVEDDSRTVLKISLGPAAGSKATS
jgi:tRNA(Ile)-lysidine synthase